MDASVGGKQPTHYKNDSFSNIERPNTWVDILMIIVIFGFYNQFLPLY